MKSGSLKSGIYHDVEYICARKIGISKRASTKDIQITFYETNRMISKT